MHCGALWKENGRDLIHYPPPQEDSQLSILRYCSWTSFETGPKTCKINIYQFSQSTDTVPGPHLKLVQKHEKSSFSGPLYPQILFMDFIWNWSENVQRSAFTRSLNPQILFLDFIWNWSENVQKHRFWTPQSTHTVPGLGLKLVRKQWFHTISWISFKSPLSHSVVTPLLPHDDLTERRGQTNTQTHNLMT